MDRKANHFHRLLAIMDTLRAQCPWDRKQTLQSLRHLSMEEFYELSDAIVAEDWKGIEEELGDLLLHIVFYAKIAEEAGRFNIDGVVDAISEKLIHRHPHIYGGLRVEDEAAVKRNWERLKRAEGKRSILGGVPNALPAMLKAYRMQEKVKGAGFEWAGGAESWKGVKEKLEVFQRDQSVKGREERFGELLFSLINCAGLQGINPEDALEKTNKRFQKRFAQVEQKAEEEGKPLSELSPAEMNSYWAEAKRIEEG